MSSDPEITKKRKLEEGEHDVSIEKIVDMISIWDTTQLVSVLSKLASKSTWALEAIKEENNKSVKLRKIFVRNLDFSTTDESLVSTFGQYGAVNEAVVIRNKSDNKSKGFGFVTFENTEGCELALQSATHEIDGRTAYVNLAAKRTVTGDHPNGAAQGTPYGGGNGQQSNVNPLTKLFVRSLSYQTTQHEFKDFFSQYGPVQEAVILTNKDGTSKGYGFLTFADVNSANRALEQSQKQLGGRDIHCKLAAANDGHVNRSNSQFGQQNQNQGGQGQQGGQNYMNRMNMMNGMQQSLMSMMMGGQNQMNQMGGGMGGGMGGSMGNANPYSALAQQQVGQQQQGNDQFGQQQLGLGGYQQQW